MNRSRHAGSPSMLVVASVLALAAGGCRAAQAQSFSHDEQPRQGFDAGLGDSGRDSGPRDGARDAIRDVRDAGSDVVHDAPGDREPPLRLPPQRPNRPIGGGPADEPDEPIPVDDAGRSPLH